MIAMYVNEVKRCREWALYLGKLQLLHKLLLFSYKGNGLKLYCIWRDDHLKIATRGNKSNFHFHFI
jgi:hypothetical protein